jgi:hypothetical protein
MLIAEELEVDLTQVRLEHAPPNEKLFGNPLLGGVRARAGVPSEADRWGSNQAFIGTTPWPETQALIGKLMEKGLQVEGDFEHRLGYHVGHAAR